MRFIIYGVGAVGGVVAGALAAAGEEVVGIARGARLVALRSGPMALRNPAGAKNIRITCVAEPAEIEFRTDDAILLTMKSQDTLPALHALRDAGVADQPVFCVQNGVANERAALRYFPNVHGVNVMLPCEFTDPAETIAFCSPNYGNFDVGRYPCGIDAADEAFAQVLSVAGIASTPMPDVMAFKYGKLILNLSNITEAALGRGVDAEDLIEVLRAEGRDLLNRLNIAWRDVGMSDPRREWMKVGSVEGAQRIGGSTSQSLARRAGSVETDYINGEIALLGRLNGIATPANTFAAKLGAQLARDRCLPGTVTHREFAAGLGL